MSEYYRDPYGYVHLINDYGLTHSYYINEIFTKKYFTLTTKGSSELARRNWTRINQEEFWEAVDNYKTMRELVR